MLKRLIIYWIPPLIWAAIIFPIGNRILGSHIIYDFIVTVIRWFVSGVSSDTISILYIVFRKFLHVVEYAIFSFLLYRGFRGPSQIRWRSEWAIYAGIVAFTYGLLDELLQSFIPVRNGSLFDVLMDMTGIILVLGTIFIKRPRVDTSDTLMTVGE